MNLVPVRTVLATVLAATSANPSARPAPLGIVTQAQDASLSTGLLSAGTSVFDGDQLSTGPAGALSLRSASATVFLSNRSFVTLHAAAGGTDTPAADLASGTLVFSTARVAAMQIDADSACIRPAASVPTVGQISVLGPQTLQVYARRGDLIFSYRDESERIGEGESYRVVLLPPVADDGTAAQPAASDRGPSPARKRRGFLFFALAAVAASILWHHIADLESPDRP
jgi:hypothetical protein